ncbi:hypothetical protein OG21DRAFT_1526342 [Imleria badia]|nr:hypothetical protein OG21DRAFT_1526342 [Imleria badia]
MSVSASSLMLPVAPKSVAGGGLVQLSVGPYQYTHERNMEVFATNQPNSVKLGSFSSPTALTPSCFHLPITRIPSIAIGPEVARVWTAGAPEEPIKFKKFTGEPNQVFRAVFADQTIRIEDPTIEPEGKDLQSWKSERTKLGAERQRRKFSYSTVIIRLYEVMACSSNYSTEPQYIHTPGIVFVRWFECQGRWVLIQRLRMAPNIEIDQ